MASALGSSFIDFTKPNIESSENNLFFVNQADRTQLYTTQNFKFKKLSFLLKKKKVKEKANGQNLYKWTTPKIQLYQKDENYYDGKKQSCSIISRKSKYYFTNDCSSWAFNLQKMFIHDTLEVINIYPFAHSATKQIPFHNLNELNQIELNVGDHIYHQFYDTNTEPAFLDISCYGHHATIIGKDGHSILTLEGHVEQNLTAPTFHIYSSPDEFIKKNLEQLDDHFKARQSGIVYKIK